MLNESLLALQRGVFMLSGMCYVLFCPWCNSLSLYNSVILPRVLKFCVHNQRHCDVFVQSDFSSLSLTLCINCFSPQITELLGTQCCATVVAFAAFGNLPTSTGRIFLLLNCQVGIALHSKGGKVKVLKSISSLDLLFKVLDSNVM